MFKNFITIMSCVALAFGMVACGDNDGDKEFDGNGGDGGVAKNEVFPEGYYYVPTRYSKNGYLNYNCNLELIQETETKYELHNVFSTGQSLRGEVKGNELIFNGEVYLFGSDDTGALTGEKFTADENGNLYNAFAGLSFSVFPFSRFDDEDYAKYKGYYPNSDYIVNYIRPYEKHGEEFKLADSYVVALEDGELINKTGLLFLSQGITIDEEGQYHPDSENGYPLIEELFYQGDTLYSSYYDENNDLQLNEKYTEEEIRSMNFSKSKHVGEEFFIIDFNVVKLETPQF